MDFNHTPYWSHFLLAEQPTTDEDQKEEDFRLCNFLQVAQKPFYIKNCLLLCKQCDDPDTSLLSSSDFHCSEYRRKYATEDPGMQFSDISKQVCFLFISKQVELLVDGAVGGVHVNVYGNFQPFQVFQFTIGFKILL